MKVILILISLIIFISPVMALPVIDNITITPLNGYIGNSINITTQCSDMNRTIERVYANISGPGITFPSLNFLLVGDLYFLGIDGDYFDRTGEFTANIVCKNDNNELSQTTAAFTISEISAAINAIMPDILYTNDVIEIDVDVRKDGNPLINGVLFNVSIDDQGVTLRLLPVFDAAKGWVLKLNPFDTSGTHDVKITVYYDTKKIELNKELTVSTDVEFSIIEIDKTSVKKNDNITLTLRASERGTPIDLNSASINFAFGSVTPEIISRSQRGNDLILKMKVPDASPGTYELTATLHHNGFVYTDSKTIEYVFVISGKIVDLNGIGMDAYLLFKRDNAVRLRANTDISGYYSGTLQTGGYNLEVVFPDITLFFNDVRAQDFDDPLKFYPLDVALPGVTKIGAYLYESSLDEPPRVEFKYRDADVDEDELRFFICTVWSINKEECQREWIEEDVNINKGSNTLTKYISNHWAFAIGYQDKLNVKFDMDRQKFFLNDVVEIAGTVQNNDGKPIDNVSIEARLQGTSVVSNAFSDNNGVFYTDFSAPDTPGNYTLTIKAQKSPYRSFEKNIVIEVSKNVALSIIFPDSLKIERGGSITQEMVFTNIGQTDIFGIKIILDGIPDNYYIQPPNIDVLLKGGQKRVPFQFLIPENASVGTQGVTIRISSPDISKERLFGLTILDKSQTVSQPTGLVTGPEFSLPEIDIDIETIFILLFAIVSFSSAYILKKRKKNVPQISTNIMQLKEHLRNKKNSGKNTHNEK